MLFTPESSVKLLAHVEVKCRNDGGKIPNKIIIKEEQFSLSFLWPYKMMVCEAHEDGMILLIEKSLLSTESDFYVYESPSKNYTDNEVRNQPIF